MTKINSSAVAPLLQNHLVKFLIPCALMFNTCAYALPAVDQIAAGDVALSASDGKLQINQASEQAIVNWHNFNISAQESVHFQQPTNGICLNRIDAINGMSQIAGQLSATGKIILINNAGILFTDTASVNVGGIIASAIDTSEHSPNLNSLRFDKPTEFSSAIINRGVINVADHGLAVLLGAGVVNEGVIAARYGQVLLETGRTFAVDFNGDGVINFGINMEMPEPSNTAALDEHGAKLPNAIDNSGKIINDYGDVVIMASAAPGIFDKLINMSGEVKATQMQKTQKGVVLVGDQSGLVHIAGKIDVGNDEVGTKAGNIIAVAHAVEIAQTAKLDGGLLVLGDSSGKIKKFDLNTSENAYVGNHITTNADVQIPNVTTAYAAKMFYDYKNNTNFTAPISNINVTQNAEDKTTYVDIDVEYNGSIINLRSIRPDDHELVQTYLNSQPLVRAKYANRNTVDAEYTQNRVQVLAERFNPDVTDGCYMHGGFIITDKETSSFLGMVNSGTSLDKGITEIAYLSRPDAWSHKPENLSSDYKIPTDLLQKDYNGLATAVASAIVQYTEQLKNANGTIKGDPITAIRAHTMLENPGGWKALAKVGFELDSIRINKDWGQDIRYRFEYKF